MTRNGRHMLIFISAALMLVFAVFLYSENSRVFPHKPHMDMEMECTACHAGAAVSEKARDNNLPDLKKCSGECHEKDILKKFAPAGSRPGYRLDFNHKMHADLDMKCQKCHKGIAADKFVPGSAFPAMKLCFECHNNDTAEKKCTKCHSEKVRFPHKTHIDASLSCDGCHTEIAKSIKTDNGPDIPGKASCNDCHEKEDGYGEVTDFQYSQSYKFNHTYHTKEQGLECKGCHESLFIKNRVEQFEIVKDYKDCCACHDNETASGYCMYCHITPIKPADHSPDWDKQHKVKAATNLKACKSCHSSKGFCSSCHNGVRKPLNSHNPNFELTHRYESRVSLKNCKSCHSERYCRNCHTARGVTTASKKYRNPHPAGWLIAGSPNFHKRKARLRLSSCTSCHTKNDCSFCHFTKRRR